MANNTIRQAEIRVIVPDMGARIKTAMLEAGLSQRELAKKAGITEGAVSRYTSGSRTPDTSTVVKLADALEVTTDYILGRSAE